MLIILNYQKKSNISNDDLSKEAIKRGFEELKNKILLEKDLIQLTNLNLSQINDLVLYYQVVTQDNDDLLSEIQFVIIFFLIKTKYISFFTKEIFCILKSQKKTYTFYLY